MRKLKKGKKAAKTMKKRVPTAEQLEKRARAFLETKGEAFYNNIIVGLPDRVRFCDEEGNYKTIDEIVKIRKDSNRW